ncbi:hypothetical protein RFM23_20990 [Mesorhizobium abyssinicae]|uniref:HEPN domain-containing protein n=1 Tax=Mesorhizobium abyssinicae TaxID=1209958 RepID=A0ABU5AS26_9HYPH|nr:hypothetical protein [Mesorhizobium abyssinicae]MDX8540099.1 hypothetical protein [Mesorhizobium abyssinicae]
MTPFGVFLFAQTYRANADALERVVAHIRPRMSDHPRRLLYFQALENFLRSFLLLHGKSPAHIRDHRHNFSAMLNESQGLGLMVSADVEKFVRSRTLANDYTRIRYDYQLEDPSARRRMAPSMDVVQTAVRQIEQVVGQAIRSTGVEVSVVEPHVRREE